MLLTVTTRRRLSAVAVLAVLATAPCFAQTQTVVFREDFESGLAAWTASGFWHVESSTTPCGQTVAPFPSGTNAAYFGRSSSCTYDNGDFSFHGTLKLANLLPVPDSGQRVLLRFRYNVATEPGTCEGYDQAIVGLEDAGGAFTGFWQNCQGGMLAPTGWQTHTADVSAFMGEEVRLYFGFFTVDAAANDYFGFMVDDVEILVEDFATPCAGDGSGIACPCGNNGAPGHGCANSFFADGALLSVAGVPHVSSDSIVLHATNVTNASGTFFQGTTVQSSTSFDGLLCVGGSLIRLGSKIGAGNASQYPEAGDALVSVRGQVPSAGGTFHYTMRYRNAAASFCPPETANFTNAVTITWRP